MTKAEELNLRETNAALVKERDKLREELAAAVDVLKLVLITQDCEWENKNLGHDWADTIQYVRKVHERLTDKKGKELAAVEAFKLVAEKIEAERQKEEADKAAAVKIAVKAVSALYQIACITRGREKEQAFCEDVIQDLERLTGKDWKELSK